MEYRLKDCRTGGKAAYDTFLTVEEREGKLVFTFTAKHSQYYCPFQEYNAIHSLGDACEILIGSDPQRRSYYEIEISPQNCLFLAKMTYLGVNEAGKPQLDIRRVDEADCFVAGKVERTREGYVATLTVEKAKVYTGEGELFFNAYRLETDGGEMEKHLFALNPTLCPKFHVPQRYVKLEDYVK